MDLSREVLSRHVLLVAQACGQVAIHWRLAGGQCADAHSTERATTTYAVSRTGFAMICERTYKQAESMCASSFVSARLYLQTSLSGFSRV